MLLEGEEFVLHPVFEVEFLGGVDGSLYADEFCVGVLHKVVYGRISQRVVYAYVCLFCAIRSEINCVICK